MSHGSRRIATASGNRGVATKGFQLILFLILPSSQMMQAMAIEVNSTRQGEEKKQEVPLEAYFSFFLSFFFIFLIFVFFFLIFAKPLSRRASEDVFCKNALEPKQMVTGSRATGQHSVH